MFSKQLRENSVAGVSWRTRLLTLDKIGGDTLATSARRSCSNRNAPLNQIIAQFQRAAVAPETLGQSACCRIFDQRSHKLTGRRAHRKLFVAAQKQHSYRPGRRKSALYCRAIHIDVLNYRSILPIPS